MSHSRASRRTLLVLSVIAVMLGGRAARAERLGGSYRGPEDLIKAATKDSGGGTDPGGSGKTVARTQLWSGVRKVRRA